MISSHPSFAAFGWYWPFRIFSKFVGKTTHERVRENGFCVRPIRKSDSQIHLKKDSHHSTDCRALSSRHRERSADLLLAPHTLTCCNLGMIECHRPMIVLWGTVSGESSPERVMGF